MPKREQNSNKSTFGHVLNISGSNQYQGAAYLSSAAILKIGAGMVTLASTSETVKTVMQLLPEVIAIRREKTDKCINSFKTILIGCGLGTTSDDIKLFKKVISKFHNDTTNLIIDADGLNILAKLYNDKDTDIVRFANNKSKRLIITPHPKEASRLLNCDIENILSNTQKSATELCNKYNCVTVLKTHRTIVCDKNTFYENQHGNSALAKAGSGDVLAGIIAGLVAQNLTLFEASKTGVYLHSVTGEIASQDLTEYSVLASDLLKYLPKAISQCISHDLSD